MTFIRALFPAYKLPLPQYVALRPERARLEVTSGACLPISSICYKKVRHKGVYCYIVPSSIVKERIPWARKVIYLFSDLIRYDSRREVTIMGIFRAFLQFIRWCDQNGLDDVLIGNKSKDREAYREYSFYLKEKVRAHKLKSVGSIVMQSQVKEVYVAIFEDPQFHQGVPNLTNRNDTESIEVPCEERQSKTLALCVSIFYGMSEFVVENKPYPHFVKLPQYLNFKDDGVWITHSSHWFDVSYIHSPQLKNKTIFNYELGKNRTANELAELTCSEVSLCVDRLKKNKRACEKANADSRCASRLDKARLAMMAFYILFIANTGMNSAQARALEWNDEFRSEHSRVGFKKIKYRAGNKLVYFEIQSTFLKHFRHYLKLRKFINDGKSVNLLFGFQGKKRIVTPNLYTLTKVVKKLDPDLSFVMPREWRAAKSDWYTKNYDSSTTAIALQNNEATTLKYYTEGSRGSHVDEMSKFLESLSQLKVDIDSSATTKKSSAVAHCRQFGSPKALIHLKSVPIDCRQPEGCLFCDKFVVHSDEKDIRKLYSCLYCIEQTAHLSATIDEYNSTFGLVKKRIEKVVSTVASLSTQHQKMVSRIKDEVMNEELLDRYWETKLTTLLELGVL